MKYKQALMKYGGFKDANEPAKLLDKHRNTIRNWFLYEPIHFEAVMIGLKAIKERQKKEKKSNEDS